MSRPVPAITQYASPSLIRAISYGGYPRTNDPRWRETGAPDLATYSDWTVRWCGMACLQMALLARDGSAPTLYDLAIGAAKYGAYVDDPDGPRGLIYRPFVAYVRAEHQLAAEVIEQLDVPRLISSVNSGRLVIASVHPEIRRPWSDCASRGGHLVLVTGYEDGVIEFNDPAGHKPEAVTASLPVETFDRFFAYRGISLQI